MLKLIKIFTCAILIFTSANCSAAAVGVSNDNIENFLQKCNLFLKANDPESNLDTPEVAAEYKYYIDMLQIADNRQVKITYITLGDKIYSIKLTADNYDDTIKSYFEGMNIIFLKSLGLSDAEAKGLTGTSGAEWQKEGFVTRLNKRFIVSLKNSTLTITADDKRS